MQKGKDHSDWLARFNRKMSFHFTAAHLGLFDWSDWGNGKHPSFQSPVNNYSYQINANRRHTGPIEQEIFRFLAPSGLHIECV